MNMTMAEIACALGLSEPVGREARATGVAIDSRAVASGDIFLCARGNRVDGHDCAVDAVRAGAVAVLAERPVSVNVPVFLVPDTIKALGMLAAAWRERFSGTVIAVTGSAGKTTVKEVLAHILRVRGAVAKNALNLNNQLGMSLSILASSGKEVFWVMELGISQPHDMDELGAILRPDMAVILNAGGAHTEGLGKRGVAHHKAALLRYVRAGGTGLVSADYADLVREARAVYPSVCFFSTTGRPVSYRAAYNGPATQQEQIAPTAPIQQTSQEQHWGSYRLWLDGQALDCVAPFYGAYGAENSIAIAAVAHSAGLEGHEIVAGFAGAVLPPQRCAVQRVGAWQLIDDTYNANPLSMQRMIHAAQERAGNTPLYAVLGAMGELGTSAPEEHETLGRVLAMNKVHAVFWRGAYADKVRAGLEAERFSGTLYCPASTEAFVKIWHTARLSPGLILCKGSRSNHLEEWVAALVPVLAGTT